MDAAEFGPSLLAAFARVPDVYSCQKALCRPVRAAGADDRLAVKANQSDLLVIIAAAFLFDGLGASLAHLLLK